MNVNNIIKELEQTKRETIKKANRVEVHDIEEYMYFAGMLNAYDRALDMIKTLRVQP